MNKQKKWGGARPGAGRRASGFSERIMLEVTPLMKACIDNEVGLQKRTRNETLRYIIGKQLGVGKKMEWNNEKGVYEGITIEGRTVAVDGDEFAEALQQAEKDGVNIDDIYSVSTWENLIGVNNNVWYVS